MRGLPGLQHADAGGSADELPDAHYDDRNVGEFGQLGGTDCVNFASQGLLARGWTMTAEWWHDNITCKTQESGRRARR